MAVKVTVRTDADVKALERYQAELDDARKKLLASGKSVEAFTKEMRKLDSQQRALNKLMPQSHSAMGKLKDMFGGFVITGGDVVNALKSVGQGLWDVAKAGAEAEKAERTLRFAVEKSGISWTANAAAIDANIQKVSWLAAVDDEELYVAQSKLMRSTNDLAKSQEMLGLATDISAVTGIDLGSVTKALSKAYLGNYGALSKLGIAVDSTKGKTAAFKTLYEQFGGAASYVSDNMIDDGKRMEVAWGNLKESIGQAIAPELAPRMENLTLGLSLLNDEAHDAGEKWALYGSMVGMTMDQQNEAIKSFLGFTDATDSMSESTFASAQATFGLNEAMQEEYELLTNMPTVLNPVEQGQLDMYEANIKVKKAQEDVNKALAEFGAGSDEVLAAQIKLEEAKRRAIEQTGQVQDALAAETRRIKEQEAAARRASIAFESYNQQRAASGTGGRNILMAAGGILPPVPGGWDVTAAEAGVPEAFIPLERTARSQSLAAEVAARVGITGGASTTINVYAQDASSIPAIEAAVSRVIKSYVRSSGSLAVN